AESNETEQDYTQASRQQQDNEIDQSKAESPNLENKESIDSSNVLEDIRSVIKRELSSSKPCIKIDRNETIASRSSQILELEGPINDLGDMKYSKSINELINKYDQVFSQHEFEVGESDKITAFIKLSPDTKPCSGCPRKLTLELQREEREQITFWSKNAPALFQRLMDSTFERQHEFVRVYFDDWIVFSRDISEHLGHLELVLSILKDNNFKLKKSKCQFVTHEVRFCGYLIRNGQIQRDKSFVAAIDRINKPTDIKSLEQFLGLANYGRNFVKDYANTVRPLNALRKKDVKFIWTSEQDIAFERIKAELKQSPKLFLFKIVTDNSALSFIKTSKEVVDLHARCLLFLEQFDYEIIHTPGRENRGADALTRLTLNNEVTKSRQLLELPPSDQFILETLRKVNKFNAKPAVVPDEQIANVLRYAHRVHLNHSAADKMIEFMKKYFIFEKEREKAANYANNCKICKFVNQKNTADGLFRPKRPAEVNAVWYMNFMQLPTIKSYNMVLVIIDQTSRFGQAYPMKVTPSFKISSKLNKAFKIYGKPKELRFDAGANFNSHDFKEYLTKQGITWQTGPAYHHQSIKTLKEALLKYNLDCESEWTDQLPLVIDRYNRTFCSAIKATPEQVFHGEFDQDSANKNTQLRQQRDARRLNRNRRKVNYTPGDSVYIKTPGGKKNLQPRFMGPFKVIKDEIIEVDRENKRQFGHVHVSNVKPASRLAQLCTDDHASIDSVDEALYLIKGVEYLQSSREDENLRSEKRFDRCMNEADSITGIKKILEKEGDLCHPTHISDMLDYKDQYLSETKSIKGIVTRTKRKLLIRRFFKRYAFSVSQMCRKNMIDNLKEAQKQMDTKILEKLIPPRRIGDFGETPKTGLKIFDSTRLVLGDTDSVEEILPIGDVDDKYRIMQSTFYLNQNEIEEYSNVTKYCIAFSEYAGTAILSVARLAGAGYAWKFGNVDHEYHEASNQDRQLLRDWLGMTHVCHTLYMMKIKNVDENPSCDFVIELNKVRFTDLMGNDKNMLFAQFKRNRLTPGKLLATDKMIIAHTDTDVKQILMKAKQRAMGMLKEYVESRKWAKKLLVKSGHKMDKSLVDQIRAELDASNGDSTSMCYGGYHRERNLKGAGVWTVIGIVVLIILGALAITFRDKMIAMESRVDFDGGSQMCRKNMIDNLKEAQRQIDPDAMKAFSPQSPMGNNVDANAESAQNDEQHIVRAIKAVFSDIDSAEKFMPMGRLTGFERMVRPTLSLNQRELGEFKVIFKHCEALSKHYETAILSVVRLASVGYAWKFDNSESEYPDASEEERQLLRDWLKESCEIVVELKSIINQDIVKEAELYAVHYARNRLATGKLSANELMIKNYGEKSRRLLWKQMRSKLMVMLKNEMRGSRFNIRLLGSADSIDQSVAEKIRKELDLGSGDATSSAISYTAVINTRVALPCDISAPSSDDSVALVLWYKDDSLSPIYTLDARKERANFEWTTSSPARLVIDPVRTHDAGDYRCRVDFRKGRTVNTIITLHVVVPPTNVSIEDANGHKLRALIGPYNEGQQLQLICTCHGGKPRPTLTWSRDFVMIDDTFTYYDNELTVNELLVTSLSRTHLLSVFTCQASNNNMTSALSTSITLDLNLKPNVVNIKQLTSSLLVGHEATFECTAFGSRPHATVHWQLDGVRFEPPTSMEQHSVSRLTLMMERKYNRKSLVCAAENPRIAHSATTESLQLDVHYAPQVTAQLEPDNSNGNSNNNNNNKNIGDIGVNESDSNDQIVNRSSNEIVQEGNDVQLTCKVDANPPSVRPVVWRHQGHLISATQFNSNNNNNNNGAQNQRANMDHSVWQPAAHGTYLMTPANATTLVMQRINRLQEGNYECEASNSHGVNTSNSVYVRVRHAPVCVHADTILVYGAERHSTLDIECRVLADPRPQDSTTAFLWYFRPIVAPANNQARTGAPQLIESQGSQILRFQVNDERQFGQLECLSKNSIGLQQRPCRFEIRPPERPEMRHECRIVQTGKTTLVVRCWLPHSVAGVASDSSGGVSSAVGGSLTSRTLTDAGWPELQSSGRASDAKSVEHDNVDLTHKMATSQSHFTLNNSNKRRIVWPPTWIVCEVYEHTSRRLVANVTSTYVNSLDNNSNNNNNSSSGQQMPIGTEQSISISMPDYGLHNAHTSTNNDDQSVTLSIADLEPNSAYALQLYTRSSYDRSDAHVWLTANTLPFDLNSPNLLSSNSAPNKGPNSAHTRSAAAGDAPSPQLMMGVASTSSSSGNNGSGADNQHYRADSNTEPMTAEQKQQHQHQLEHEHEQLAAANGRPTNIREALLSYVSSQPILVIVSASAAFMVAIVALVGPGVALVRLLNRRPRHRINRDDDTRQAANAKSLSSSNSSSTNYSTTTNGTNELSMNNANGTANRNVNTLDTGSPPITTSTGSNNSSSDNGCSGSQLALCQSANHSVDKNNHVVSGSMKRNNSTYRRQTAQRGQTHTIATIASSLASHHQHHHHQHQHHNRRPSVDYQTDNDHMSHLAGIGTKSGYLSDIQSNNHNDIDVDDHNYNNSADALTLEYSLATQELCPNDSIAPIDHSAQLCKLEPMALLSAPVATYAPDTRLLSFDASMCGDLSTLNSSSSNYASRQQPQSMCRSQSSYSAATLGPTHSSQQMSTINMTNFGTNSKRQRGHAQRRANQQMYGPTTKAAAGAIEQHYNDDGLHFGTHQFTMATTQSGVQYQPHWQVGHNNVGHFGLYSAPLRVKNSHTTLDLESHTLLNDNTVTTVGDIYRPMCVNSSSSCSSNSNNNNNNKLKTVEAPANPKQQSIPVTNGGSQEESVTSSVGSSSCYSRGTLSSTTPRSLMPCTLHTHVQQHPQPHHIERIEERNRLASDQTLTGALPNSTDDEDDDEAINALNDNHRRHSYQNQHVALQVHLLEPQHRSPGGASAELSPGSRLDALTSSGICHHQQQPQQHDYQSHCYTSLLGNNHNSTVPGDYPTFQTMSSASLSSSVSTSSTAGQPMTQNNCRATPTCNENTLSLTTTTTAPTTTSGIVVTGVSPTTQMQHADTDDSTGNDEGEEHLLNASDNSNNKLAVVAGDSQHSQECPYSLYGTASVSLDKNGRNSVNIKGNTFSRAPTTSASSNNTVRQVHFELDNPTNGMKDKDNSSNKFEAF
ncbi:Ty3b-i, partial [Fragariocoptes setiger]